MGPRCNKCLSVVVGGCNFNYLERGNSATPQEKRISGSHRHEELPHSGQHFSFWQGAGEGVGDYTPEGTVS